MADITNQQLLEAMTQQLGVITDNMVTKQDLKEELKRFVTKDDLKKELGDIRDEQLRQGVLLKALDEDLKAVAESVIRLSSRACRPTDPDISGVRL